MVFSSIKVPAASTDKTMAFTTTFFNHFLTTVLIMLFEW